MKPLPFHPSVTRRALLGAAAALPLSLVFSGRLLADDAPATPETPAPKAKPAPVELGLDDHMKAMGHDFKQLRKAAAAGTLGPELADVAADMESHAAIAKTMMPPNAMNLSGADQAAFVMGFRKKMIETIGQMLQLESALLESRTKDAEKLIGDIGASMKEGHRTYNKKEKM